MYCSIKLIISVDLSVRESNGFIKNLTLVTYCTIAPMEKKRIEFQFGVTKINHKAAHDKFPKSRFTRRNNRKAHKFSKVGFFSQTVLVCNDRWEHVVLLQPMRYDWGEAILDAELLNVRSTLVTVSAFGRRGGFFSGGTEKEEVYCELKSFFFLFYIFLRFITSFFSPSTFSFFFSFLKKKKLTFYHSSKFISFYGKQYQMKCGALKRLWRESFQIITFLHLKSQKLYWNPFPQPWMQSADLLRLLSKLKYAIAKPRQEV